MDGVLFLHGCPLERVYAYGTLVRARGEIALIEAKLECRCCDILFAQQRLADQKTIHIQLLHAR